MAITSDYVYRGISQTLEEPALQGGFDVGTAFGGYLGVWGSSVNFGEDLGVGPRAQAQRAASLPDDAREPDKQKGAP